MVCKVDIQKLGDALKDTFITGNNEISTVRKGCRQCPLVLLATVGWRQSRALRTGEGRGKGRGIFV
jgi:hypothetical protein